jgi:hypothetical protein
MAMREEFSDPWGWLLAIFAGGLTWAVLGGAGGLVGVLAGLIVGSVVFGTKVVVGSLMHRDQPAAVTSRSDALPLPPPGSQADAYLQRARQARRQMADLAERPGDAWLRNEVGRMDDGADAVMDSLADLAGRVTLADKILANARAPLLAADREAVAAQLEQTTDPMLAEERRRSLAALDQQLAGLERMRGLREALLARMATAVVGLESVATRMGEVVTMGADAYQHDAAGAALRDAGADLEALRTGLAEAQQLARGVGTEG